MRRIELGRYINQISTLTITNARILTLAGATSPRRGAALRDLGVIENGFVRIEGGRIVEVGEGEPTKGAAPAGDGRARSDSRDVEIIDADGCVLMPAFVDCHTHACWAGDRFDEFEMKLAGCTYLEILNSGGGIMSTVRAVRAVTQQELVDLLLHRLERMTALGTGTVEVKSGYGLTTNDELKMLRAVREAASGSTMTIVPTFLGAHAIDTDNPDFIEQTIGETLPKVCSMKSGYGLTTNDELKMLRAVREAASGSTMTIVPTFLGAHAIDTDNPDFIEQTIGETLPKVAEEFPGIVCDAYCEQGAWSLDDTKRLFEKAQSLGLPLRVHADQFNSLGMTRLAVDMNAISVDHLEATTPDDLKYLAASDTMGVALPACGFHLDGRYAPAREFVDAGGALAIATNYNPGSAPTPSMPFVIALACRKLGLAPAEAITCSTMRDLPVDNCQLRAG